MKTNDDIGIPQMATKGSISERSGRLRRRYVHLELLVTA